MDRAGSGSRALFPKGPSFTLEDFSNKDFIVRDFVDSLAENAGAQNRRSGAAQQAFDPKPLIRGFESMAGRSKSHMFPKCANDRKPQMRFKASPASRKSYSRKSLNF
jgi:hypothetical protein